MLWKCCTQYASKSGNLSSGHRTGKGQFSFQSQRKNAKECSNYHSIALILYASKVIVKIFQARLQQYVNWEVPSVQAGFRKGRGTRDQIVNTVGSLKKHQSSRKTSISALLTTPKLLTMWITTNWKFLKEMGIPDHLTCFLRNLCASQEATVRTRHGQRTGSRLGKEYIKAVYCHPAYLISVQSTSCKMPGWMKQKLKSRLLGEISITSDMQIR